MPTDRRLRRIPLRTFVRLSLSGEGIDLAQSLRPEEPSDPEFSGDLLGNRLNYDARLSMRVDRDAPADAGYEFSLSFRSAVGISRIIVWSTPRA